MHLVQRTFHKSQRLLQYLLKSLGWVWVPVQCIMVPGIQPNAHGGEQQNSVTQFCKAFEL